jgi:hypothetical protein
MNADAVHPREKLSWILIAAFWPAVGILFMSVGLFSDPATFDLGDSRQLFLDWMTWVQWGIFSIPILLIAAAIRRHRSAAPAVALHLLTALGFTLLHLTSYLLLVELVRGPAAEGLPGILEVALLRLPRHLLYNPIIYAAIVLAGSAVHQQWNREQGLRRQELMERLVAEAELNLLRARIQPSFVISSLAAIGRLVERDPSRAEDAILRLSDFLRLCLKNSERDHSSVADEVAAVRAWLDVLSVTAPAGRRMRLSVERSALDCPIPPAFLQVLIDYAVATARDGQFELHIAREDFTLTFRMHIETLTEGLSASPQLTAAQSIIRRAYGSQFGLNHHFEPGSTDLEFTLPIALENDSTFTRPESLQMGDHISRSDPWRVAELSR